MAQMKRQAANSAPAQAEAPQRSNRPDYKVFVSRQMPDGKKFYTEVGAAWLVANNGVSIKLHCLPVDGSLICFPPREEQGG